MSLDMTKIYDKKFFSKVGSEYICTGFMFEPVPASIITGVTTTHKDANPHTSHSHKYEVDENGNGWALMVKSDLQTVTDADTSHWHKIENGVVLMSQSECWGWTITADGKTPLCGETPSDYFGAGTPIGVGPHTHDIKSIQKLQKQSGDLSENVIPMGAPKLGY